MQNKPVIEKEFYLESSKKFRFCTKSYYPEDKQPKAIIQVVHGMAEHIGRYHDFALFLASQGFAVFLHNHPGHGQEALKEKRLGDIPKHRGWQIMLENTRAVYTYIRKKEPEIPLFIFAHSMGTIIARHFLAVYPVYLKGLILSGPFETSPGLVKASYAIVRINGLLTGSRHKSKWFNKLFYKNFNRHFKNPPSLFEWISSSRKETDAYVKDPLCGFFCSNSFYYNLFRGITAMKKSQQNLKYRKTLPVLIISGKHDPVGNFGKSAIKIHQDFYKQKFQNLTVKIITGRHELLHEKEKQETYLYLNNWLTECLTKKKILT